MYRSYLIVVLFCANFNNIVVNGGALYQEPGLIQRPLIVKSYPAVDNYQSDLYEVYMEPYTYVS